MLPLPAVAVVACVVAVSSAARGDSVHWFHSPSGNIQCEMASSDSRGTYVYCQTSIPPQSVRLGLNGRSRICSGIVCLGNGPRSPELRYGSAVRVGPFWCSSATVGVRCTTTSHHGFRIAREGVATF
jgi:hypothetical protein